MADNGKGVLFKNDKKKKDSHPDYTGNVTLTKDLLNAYLEEMGSGTELKVDLAAWIKQGQKSKFFSLSISAPFKGERKSNGGRPATTNVDDDPF